MGFSQHSGMVIVCDGTDEAAERIARVLHNDPTTSVSSIFPKPCY